jgi:hypothetical protein
MKYLFGIIFLISVKASAQINMGARFNAMASSGVSLSDVWSIHHNQAGLAAVKRFSVAVAYEKPFSGYDLKSHSTAIVLPVQNNVFGLSVQQYGNLTYIYQSVGLSYAKNFGNQLFAAMAFNYHSLKIDNYGNTHTYSVAAGLQYKINKNLTIGAHLSSPGFRDFDKDLELPVLTRIQLGASYHFSEKFLLAMSADKSFRGHLDVRTGVEYRIIEMLSLRGGLSANAFRQYAGFGVNYKKLNMDLSVSSQPIVGYSPQISLSYEL